MKLRAVAAATALVAAMPAFAQDTGGFQVGLTGGTLGIGPEIGFRTPAFGVRGNATFLGLGREVESDGVVYDGDLRLRSFGGMLDFYPGGGGFRRFPIGDALERRLARVDRTDRKAAGDRGALPRRRPGSCCSIDRQGRTGRTRRTLRRQPANHNVTGNGLRREPS